MNNAKEAKISFLTGDTGNLKKVAGEGRYTYGDIQLTITSNKPSEGAMKAFVTAYHELANRYE